MQFIQHLEPFLNVAASSRAVLNSKKVLGNVVERVYLVLGGGNNIANLSTIRIRLNGKVVFGDISGSQVNLMQRYLLLQNTAGFLTLQFSEPTARSIQGELMGALNTNAAGVNDFVIETDLGAGVAPTQDAWVQLRAPTSMLPQAGFDPSLAPILRAVIPTVITETGAGEFQHDVNYGSGGNSLIKRLWIFSSILTSFRIKADSLDIFESVTAALNTYIELDYAKVAQTNLYVYDPLMDGNQSDALPTRRGDRSPRNFQFLFTASGAGTHTVFADVYSTLDSL